MSLSEQQRQFYEENGYLYPLQVFSAAETADFRRQFDDYTAQNCLCIISALPMVPRRTSPTTPASG